MNNEDMPTAALASPSTLCRAINRAHQADQLTDETMLDFDINTDFLPPNFFRSDVQVKNYRHLLLLPGES